MPKREPLRPWLPGYFCAHPEPWFHTAQELPPAPPIWQWQREVVRLCDLTISRMLGGFSARPGLRLPPPPGD